MSPFPDLDGLLPSAPARILSVGGHGATEGLSREGLDLREIATTAELDPGTNVFDAVVWHVDGPGEPADAAVERLGGCLGEEGRVIVVAPLPADEPAPTRRRGSLPSRYEERLREIVRRLTETGFAIHKDGATRPADGDPGRFRVLAARRDPFVVRSYREGDEDAILQLFRDSFHLDRGLDHWRWKYAANPYSPPMISLALSREGELAAHYSGYPIPFWRSQAGGGRTFMAQQMGDTMTGPSFRNAGRGKGALLARTVRHFFSLHRDGTFGFFYGFNTGPIQRFCRWFIGGSDTLPVRYLACDLTPAPGWTARGYRVERIERVDGAWDRFFRRVAPAYGFLVRRDAEYLDWRYLRCPDTDYVLLATRRWGRLVGWSVFRRREDTVEWGDALFDPRHARAAEPLLAAALAAPELAGAKRMAAWFPERPGWWRRRLDELGFTVRPEPQELGMVALADSEPEAFAELGELYYTMGDGDLF